MPLRTRILAGWVVALLVVLPASARAQWQADGTPVCIGSWGKQHPVLVAANAGGVYAVWEDFRADASNGRIYAQLFDAAGVPQWPANGIALDLSRPYSQTGVVAESDHLGGVIVAWIEYTGSNEVIRTQRLSSTGATQWTAIVCGAPSFRRYLSIVSDGVNPITHGTVGGVVLAWVDDRNSGTATADVYAQRMDGNGNALWTPDGVPVSTAAGQQWSPVVVTDGLGALLGPRSVIVSWTDTRTDPGDVYSQRLAVDGTPQWAANGVAACAADSSQGGVAAAFAGSGNAIVCWNDLRNGNRAYDLFAQRVGSAGAWSPATGVPVCVAPGGRAVGQSVVTDGVGGALFTWQDDRNGGIADVYAQRVDATGAARWTANGIPVCSASGSQVQPVATTDASGGVIVAWADFRGGSESDVYAARIDSTGAALWAANGIRLCHAGGSQLTRSIMGDGAGGAVVLWEDGRAVNPGLYIQHVAGGGQALAVGDRATQRFRAFASPNPTAGRASVRFELPARCRVTAQVLGVDGRIVRTLFDGGEFDAGAHALEWDGRGEDRARVPAGVYFVSVRAGPDRAAQRVLVVR